MTSHMHSLAYQRKMEARAASLQPRNTTPTDLENVMFFRRGLVTLPELTRLMREHETVAECECQSLPDGREHVCNLCKNQPANIPF
jgi:hypothetical protein